MAPTLSPAYDDPYPLSHHPDFDTWKRSTSQGDPPRGSGRARPLRTRHTRRGRLPFLGRDRRATRKAVEAAVTEQAIDSLLHWLTGAVQAQVPRAGTRPPGSGELR